MIAKSQTHENDNYLTHSRGAFSWIFTLDHKRIGLMYLVAVLTAMFLGGMFAMLVRSQLLKPEGLLFFKPPGVLDAACYKPYNQIFTLHGAIMIFLVLIPGVPAVLGNFVLPLMLGAKDVAFPRLNLWSFYFYILGTLFFLSSIVLGAVDTGWTFYTPYSTRTSTSVICVATGVFILGFSSILTGLNFIVTIHKLRPRGMTWTRLPLFAWSLYATALIQVIATPVLAITVLLLIMEKLFHPGIFDPDFGGNSVLFQHFFWFYSHPAVYIMILPAMGIMSELLATFSRREVFGYRFVAMSSIAIALIGFFVWGHHMFPNGQSAPANVIFSALTVLVAIPSAIKVWNWLATLYMGSIWLKAPMLYALGFLVIFAIGGLTGLPLAILVTNFNAHDTYFVVAHFHYVMFSVIFIFIGGLHYWWPKMTGRMYDERLAQAACALEFIAFHLTFLPQFLMGSLGMPRRYAVYPPEFLPYHAVSSVGAFLQMASFLLVGACLLHSLFRGKKAPANPWGGSTLEWACSSPPPHDNFKDPPAVGRPYDHRGLEWDEASESFVRREKETVPSEV